MSRLLSQPPSWWSADDLHDLREAGERFSSVAEDLGAAEDRAKVLQDEFSAKLAEEANRNLFRLSIVTLIFLPMTLVTGIFGMNVAGLPGTHEALSFWWVMVLMVASAASDAAVAEGQALVLRRSRRFSLVDYSAKELIF